MEWSIDKNKATLVTKSGYCVIELERPLTSEPDKWMVKHQSLPILDTDAWYNLDIAMRYVDMEFSQTAVVQSINDKLALTFRDYKEKRDNAGMDGKKLAELKGMRQVMCDILETLGDGVIPKTRQAFREALKPSEIFYHTMGVNKNNGQ